MTREEAIATAIATLENIKQFGIDKWMFDKEEIEAFDMAIEVLSEQNKLFHDAYNKDDLMQRKSR